MLREGAWLRHATHANEMARLLESRIRGLPNVSIAYPVQTNAVFASIPTPIVQELYARGWKFYTNVGVDYARLMCSWDTTAHDVESFAADLRELAEAKPAKP
jgi:threonine aldolase